MKSVAIVMGSDSDLEIMQEAKKVLDQFGVPSSIQVLSAHRSPDLASEFAKSAFQNNIGVIIAGAGGSAHLAGVVAAHTILPVIGVPIPTNIAGGLDSLLSTVQMPGGIPVATVAANKGGAVNAGLLAVQMLALSDVVLQKKLKDHKDQLVKGVVEKNRRLKEKS